ncbi:tRNA-intron lyase [Candidatus Bathyarchaeota archaeon]|nr:MAG: tRNA-intron lyase [Candidatus Bathyarchaeota archaeon]
MSKTRFEAYLVENRLIVWNPKQGSELYKLGYYGKPLGIPKPKTPEFNVPLLLDMLEGLYLKEKGILTVYKNGKKLTKKELIKKAKETYEDFQLKYMVYKDLREHNLIVQPGIKFGCDFAVYEHGPGIDHAPYLIQVKKPEETMDATEIVRAGRLATTVRKRFIVAIPDLKTKKIEYLIFKWWKA